MSFPQKFPGPQEDGILLLSAYGEMGRTGWRGTRHGQVAQISGAHVVQPGPWPGSHAITPVPGGSPRNLVQNPSLEANATGWLWASCSVHERSNEQARFTSCSYGAWSFKVVTSADAASVCFAPGGSGYISVTGDALYSVSLWVYSPSGGTTARIGWAEWAGDSYLGMNTTGDIAIRPGWQRLHWSYNTSATCTKVRPYLHQLKNGQTFYLDGLQFEAGGVTPYCDGEQSGCSWTGGEHASTSNRTGTEVQYDNFALKLSGQDKMSIRAVVQAPFDANSYSWPSSNYNTVFDIKGANDDNRIFIIYSLSGTKFRVYINGDYRIEGSAKSFKAGDWLDLVLTVDFDSESYTLYVNGTQDGFTDTPSLVAPTFGAGSKLNLGALTNNTYYGGFAIAEVAFWTKKLTTEVSGMAGDYLVDSAWDGSMPIPLVWSGGEVTPYNLTVVPDKYYWGWRTKEYGGANGDSFVTITGREDQEGLEIVEWYGAWGPRTICSFRWGAQDIEWNFDPTEQADTVTITSAADFKITTADSMDITLEATGSYGDITVDAARRTHIHGKKVQITSNATYDWGYMTNGDLVIKADDGILISNTAGDQDENITIQSGQSIVLEVYAPNPQSGYADYIECKGALKLYSCGSTVMGPPDNSIWYSTQYGALLFHRNGGYYKLDMTQL